MDSADMNEPLPTIFLARHGETAWSISGQHTGRTDLPLTKRGERDALRLGDRLRGRRFAAVLASPLQRASRTCALAGFGDLATQDDDLDEWDYGEYEGRTSAQILAERPDWELFRDGCPGGETPKQVGDRADRVIQRLRELNQDVLVFSSGHILRVLAARWIGMDTRGGEHFLLGTGSLSTLGYEHNLSRSTIGFWNDATHLKS